MNKCVRGQKCYAWISSRLFFNVLLRFFMEGYLEFAVAAMINIKHARFDYSGEIAGILFSLVMFLLVFSFPILVFLFIFKNQTQIQNSSFLGGRLLALYDENNRDSLASSLFHMVFAIRRLFLAMEIVFMVEYLQL